MLGDPANEKISTNNIENPYTPSPLMAPEDSYVGVDETTPWIVGRSILTWTIVCSLSAAPSFVFAIGEIAKNQAVAMVLGIIIFIAIYSTADLVTRYSPFRRNPRNDFDTRLPAIDFAILPWVVH